MLHELTRQWLEVLPLVYNALESEHADVQERALKSVPDLCETIDYAEVQGVLFPRVAVRAINIIIRLWAKFRPQLVFTKTKVLTVKIATLATFLVMVKTLDTVRTINFTSYSVIHSVLVSSQVSLKS